MWLSQCSRRFWRSRALIRLFGCDIAANTTLKPSPAAMLCKGTDGSPTEAHCWQQSLVSGQPYVPSSDTLLRVMPSGSHPHRKPRGRRCMCWTSPMSSLEVPESPSFPVVVQCIGNSPENVKRLACLLCRCPIEISCDGAAGVALGATCEPVGSKIRSHPRTKPQKISGGSCRKSWVRDSIPQGKVITRDERCQPGWCSRC